MEEKTIITSSTASERPLETLSRAGERIIPITILSSRHRQNDENDNNANVASIDMGSKRLSMPISSNNNPTETLGGLPPPASGPNNVNNGIKRHSLLVTLDDGTTTETQGSVTNLATLQRLQTSPTPPSSLDSNGLSIQEIGQDTFKRELLNRQSPASQTATPTVLPATPTVMSATPLVEDSHAHNSNFGAKIKESPAAPSPSVRVVPIKLVDGKVIHRQPDESMQINSEFTNFSHQEFPGNEFSKGTSEPETIIPRLDNIESGRKGDVKKEPLDERIVPIKLMETGETLMPTFTQLEDPKLPEWSTFNSLNKAPEREVPLKTEQNQKNEQQTHEQQTHEQQTHEQQNHEQQNHEQKNHEQQNHEQKNHEQQNHEQKNHEQKNHEQQNQEQQRGRERSRNAAPTQSDTPTVSATPPSPKTSTTGRSPSALGKKNSVRFDLDNHQTSAPIRREEKTTSERRSSSVETFTRKTSTTSTSSKPPTIPKKSSNTTPSKSTPWRTASTERPASAMAMSPKTERTLQEIDRDINQIWQELQELEKLPNGTYRPRRPSAGSTGGRPASPGGVAKGVPGGVAKPKMPQAAAAAAAVPPVTPVRVKATYTASPATPKKYSTHDPPPSRGTSPVGVSAYPVGVSTPNTQRRTIWDMDSEMAAAAAGGTGGAAVAQCSKSNPVTPQVAKKIELPPRAPPTVVPASAFSAATPPPPNHNAPSSAKTAHDRPPLPNCGMRPLAQPPLPPIPPHMRPQHIKMAPMARDESFYDLGSTKSPASEAGGGLTTPSSAYDNNEYSPASGKFKGFPYIDGAPRKRSESPSNKQNNNFSLLVDKSSQTDGDATATDTGTPNSNNDHNAEMNAENGKQRKSKDTCAIL